MCRVLPAPSVYQEGVPPDAGGHARHSPRLYPRHPPLPPETAGQLDTSVLMLTYKMCMYFDLEMIATLCSIFVMLTLFFLLYY